MRRILLGPVLLLALMTSSVAARASSADDFGLPRTVAPFGVGMTDWATATASSGTTAYAFRRAHRVGLRIRFPGGRLGRPLARGLVSRA
ncbi:MAG TPA: hypothetical protein VHW64_15410 [Nocardioides sp.]|uniref:hypothetical protein n=1 Tax=Nocardioides sp. TaxID=35761 RepID=UPI002E37CAC0|nr:hypothetical protein [Nocardioides sp.]HEX3932091.1 hypothetical protein [Nocardioides sp.]